MRLDFSDIPTGVTDVAQDSNLPSKGSSANTPTSQTPTTRQTTKGPAPPIPVHATQTYRYDHVSCFVVYIMPDLLSTFVL